MLLPKFDKSASNTNRDTIRRGSCLLYSINIQGSRTGLPRRQGSEAPDGYPDSNVKVYADVTKMDRNVSRPRDHSTMQTDVGKRGWPGKWVLYCNVAKCSVMLLGKQPDVQPYRLRRRVMCATEGEQVLAGRGLKQGRGNYFERWRDELLGNAFAKLKSIPPENLATQNS